MLNTLRLSAAALTLIIAGTASAQWVGPSAPDSRMKYEGGPVYVGATGLTTAKFGVVESSPGARTIGSYGFIGTPVNGSRTTALWGETNNPKGRGLQGFNFATADSGDTSNPATGIWAETASVTGQGIRARATSTTGSNFAGYFDSASNFGTAVYGIVTNSSNAGIGVHGVTSSPDGYSVYGQSLATTGAGTGVQGTSTAPSGFGLYGYCSHSTGSTIAVYGNVASANGYAGYFFGPKNYFSGNVGVGTNSPSTKLDVTGTSSTGLILGTNDSTATGSTTGEAVAGVKGVISATLPGSSAAGVWGVAASSSSSSGFGVAGYHASNNGLAVAGFVASGGSGVAVYGQASGGYAGYFNGNVSVLGTLSKSGGSFKIDHPLDPAHKTLSHSFVESPDMMNIYNGNVETDPSGYATITMPDWFESLNRDFRYQLTIIDTNDDTWAMAKVVREIKDGQFTIRTNLPNQKISWMVTGIRQDNWANANRIPVEQVKPAHEQGKYLNPVEFGQPASAGIGYRDTSEFAKESQSIMKRQAALDKEQAAAKARQPNVSRIPTPPTSNPAPLTPAIAGGN